MDLQMSVYRTMPRVPCGNSNTPTLFVDCQYETYNEGTWQAVERSR